MGGPKKGSQVNAAASSYPRASWGTHQIQERSSRSAKLTSTWEVYNEHSCGQADRLVLKVYKIVYKI